ncbi:MAG: acetyl-CoA acetyltransferase [Actinobacteria bacterium]|nr:acetyl-CoA acetyltransferase [Actinomycetota bacterium]
MSCSLHDIAIIGVGASKFGENFDMDVESMLVAAAYEAYEDAGVKPEDIQAAWIGIQYPFTGLSGATLADPLKLYHIPITHTENYCVSGLDSFRNACLGVASGMYDLVMAAGVEKLTDQAGRGLPTAGFGHPVLLKGLTAPSAFGLAFPQHARKYGTTKEDLAHVAVKNHYNGAAHPKAHFRREVTLEQVMKAPIVSGVLGLLDCCAISDGAAAVIITRREIARKYRDDYVVLRGLGLSVFSNLLPFDPDFDYLTWIPTVKAARVAYEMAGIENPREEIDCAEVHDCFTITEILNYEDLGFCAKGEGGKFVREGRASIDGDVAVNPSGGLKCFGHPIGATGCRMVYEITRQLQGRAEGRQREGARTGLVHNLGGLGGVVCGVAVLSSDDRYR